MSGGLEIRIAVRRGCTLHALTSTSRSHGLQPRAKLVMASAGQIQAWPQDWVGQLRGHLHRLVLRVSGQALYSRCPTVAHVPPHSNTNVAARRLAGTHLLTGEEVGIKLVGFRVAGS
jgi:hypothetical protein